MELALTLLAFIGALLFLVGYLAFVRASFKHHFVTGVISIFPVFNIVAVPAVWHKISRKLVWSFLGALIIVASWFFGADKGVTHIFNLVTGKGSSESVIAAKRSQKPLALNNSTVKIRPASTVDDSDNKTSMPILKQRTLDERNLQGLPLKALYKMSFELIPVDKISTLKGRIIQVLSKDNQTLEGQLVDVSNSSAMLYMSGTTNEIPLANIKQLRLMVKKAIK